MGKTCSAHRSQMIKVYKILAGKPERKESRDSSVGVVTRLRAGDRGSGVRFPAGTENFSLHYRVQNGSGAHPASYPMGTEGSFPGGKVAGS
jgi:hypothetical protein